MEAADSAIESSVQWAVCPRIDLSDLNQKPKYFSSKAEADLDLDYPLDLEESLQRLEDDDGALAQRSIHSTVTKREMECVAHPVAARPEASGPRLGLTLRQFFEKSGKRSRSGAGSGVKLDYQTRLYYQMVNALNRDEPFLLPRPVPSPSLTLKGSQTAWGFPRHPCLFQRKGVFAEVRAIHPNLRLIELTRRERNDNYSSI